MSVEPSGNEATEKSADENLKSDPQIAVSLLEANGFTIIRKVGTGSYSKVKVKTFLSSTRTWHFISFTISSSHIRRIIKQWSPLKSCRNITFRRNFWENSFTTKSRWLNFWSTKISSSIIKVLRRCTGERDGEWKLVEEID